MDVAHAESARVKHRQVACVVDICAFLSEVERLPEAGTLRFSTDCQMVVSGFGARIVLADDDRSSYAGTPRLINEAIARVGEEVAVEVFKVKAHRNKERVRPKVFEDILRSESVYIFGRAGGHSKGLHSAHESRRGGCNPSA